VPARAVGRELSFASSTVNELVWAMTIPVLLIRFPLPFLQDSSCFFVLQKRWQSPVYTTLAFLFPYIFAFYILIFDLNMLPSALGEAGKSKMYMSDY
jgi:hypothetical protein